MSPAGNAALLLPAQPSHRLIAGIALSVAVHALVVLGITPAPLRTVTWAPLQVELRGAEAHPTPGEISAERPSEPATAVPAEALPEVKSTPDAPPPAVAPSVPAVPVSLAAPADQYFTVRDLDVRAELVNEVALVYPVKAYEMRLQGRVVVRMLINEHGGVDGVTVMEAAPPGVFEEAALEATHALIFRPAQRHGRNVKSQKTIEVTFDPYESIRPR